MGGVWVVSRDDGQKLRQSSLTAWVRKPPSLLLTTKESNAQKQVTLFDRRQAFSRSPVCDCCHELIALSCSQGEVSKAGSL